MAEPDEAQEVNTNLQCRYYREKFPEVEQLVTVKVLRVEELGAYVSLIEYNGAEGMILLSELSKRRIRSINKLIKIGRVETVMVLRVDSDKGYIDLSKRRVAAEDIPAHENKFNKARAVHSILYNVSDKCEQKLEDMYEQIGWPLYDKYGHAYEAFKLCLTDSTTVLQEVTCSDKIKDALLKEIRLRLAPQPVKLRADFEVTCFSYFGIEAIRESLRAGIDAGKGDDQGPQISIKLIAPPLYVMLSTSLDKDVGIEKLNASLAAIKSCLDAKGGKMTIKMEPRAVGEREDKQLETLMEQLEKQNMEVSGDDNDSSDED